MTTRGLPPDYFPDDLEHVPTVPELVTMGLARVVDRNRSGDAAVYTISPDGVALLDAIQARNAQRMIAHLKRRTP